MVSKAYVTAANSQRTGRIHNDTKHNKHESPNSQEFRRMFTNSYRKTSITFYVGLVKIKPTTLNSDLNWSFIYFSNGCRHSIYAGTSHCMWTDDAAKILSQIKYLILEL